MKKIIKKIIKKILILICSISIVTELYSQSSGTSETIKWYSFEEAVVLNSKNPRKIFIDIYTDWCGWCKQLDKNTFSNPVIIKLMNKSFYAVKLNAERKDTVVFNGYTFVNPNPTGFRSAHQLASSLLKGQMSYPSMVFLDEKTQLITTVQSYLKPTDLEPILDYISLNKYQTMEYDSFRLTFTSQISNITTIAASTIILNKVNFDAEQSVIKEISFSQLDSLVNIFKNNANIKFEINGFTDNTGDANSNKTLSEKRAKAVYDYFAAKGIVNTRMIYAGYGSLNPIADNSTTEGQKRNRRIEIKIISK